MKLFCFGLGYSAQYLANELSSTSWQYSGTHKSSGDFIFDGDSPLQNAKEILQDVTHLLISIAPDKNGNDLVLQHHKQDIINCPNLKWIGYLSATSVYGNHNGNWVDENTIPKPSDDRGKARLNAEQQWLSLNLPVHIFRLGGIYGPNRNQIAAVKNNTAQKIIKKNQTFSRIHVHDICGALMASIDHPQPKTIYNIVDDQPTSSADVLDYICHILKEPIIKGTTIDQMTLSPTMQSFYNDNKKVRNDIAKKELDWQLKFPNYKDGYADILTKIN